MQNPGKAKPQSVQTIAMVQRLRHDTCLDKKFSISFYFIQDSTFALSTPSIMVNNDALITKILQVLNTAFKPICVSFESCKKTIIPNYNYNKWRKYGTDPVVVSNYYTDKTINLYLPEEFIPPPPDPGEPYSYAYPPPASPTVAPRDVIVVQRASSADTNSSGFRGSRLLHAFGHYFGLPDTFDEINPTLPVSPGPPANVISREFVNRSNCYTHGDGFCDTEADPYPIGSTTSPPPYCYINSGIRDGNGDQYVAPTTNIMSASSCRCIFSQEQYNHMAHIIVTKRLYLH